MKVISVAGGQFEGMQVVSKSLVSDFGCNYSQSQKITSSYNRLWVILELYFPLLMIFFTRSGVQWFDPSPFIRCPLDMALDGRGKNRSSTLWNFHSKPPTGVGSTMVAAARRSNRLGALTFTLVSFKRRWRHMRLNQEFKTSPAAACQSVLLTQ